DASPNKEESVEADIQWNRIVELEIVPHPNLEHPESIAIDYAMKEGVLHLNVRAAMAGYLLRLWRIDCSKEHNLMGKEFQLWLQNWQALYGVTSADLAPGYSNTSL